jgi:predicted nucleic acid-binding protein
LLAYLDTSAFVKLVRSEPESHALRAELLAVEAELVSSVLLSVEGRRAARRYGKLASIRAHTALTTITLLALDHPIIELAGDIEAVDLRSLDALHLATILSLGDDVERMYCYDSRLSGAARSLGIEVSRPS